MKVAQSLSEQYVRSVVSISTRRGSYLSLSSLGEEDLDVFAIDWDVLSAASWWEQGLIDVG